jgi:putative oxidoreductase
MSETNAAASSPSISPANDNPGVAALARLSERIATLVPPEAAASFGRRPLSPAVEAGLARASAISQHAAERAARPAHRARSPGSTVGMVLDSFVAACSFVPYALVALGMRLVMARIFFLDGQTRIGGPRLSLDVYGLHLSAIVPAQVKATTFTAFATQFAPLPVPPMLAAYLVSYAEFILPIMLVLGLGARIATLVMLIMTAVISIYIMPEALWAVQIYWFAILMLLLSQGPGRISVDFVVRWVTGRA